MVNQSSLLVKLDSGLMERLDSLCFELGCKRNRLINFAIFVMLDNMTNVNSTRLTAIYNDSLLKCF